MAVGTVTVLVLTFRARFFFLCLHFHSDKRTSTFPPHGNYKSRRRTVFLLFLPFALIPDVSTCFFYL